MAIVTVEKNRYMVESLYQWDLNQVLTIYGLSLPSIPEIHFTNDVMDKAIVRQATMNDAGVITASIPNSLLQKPYKIKAYVCIYESGTFESLYLVEIPVKARTKPSDYTIENSDGEIYSFNALENKVNNVLVEMNLAYNEAINSVKNVRNEAINDIESCVEQGRKDLDVAGISEKAETAVAIAKGKNQAHVFSTTDAMISWLSNAENAGLWKVGDNIYIVDVGVPDWWISEVLTEADAETGYYYKIAQLETQKVDLTEIETEIGDLQDQVSEQNKNFEWKKVNAMTDVPTSANEICVCVRATLTTNVVVRNSVIIPYSELKSEAYHSAIMGFYATASLFGHVDLDVTLDTATVAPFYTYNSASIGGIYYR